MCFEKSFTLIAFILTLTVMQCTMIKTNTSKEEPKGVSLLNGIWGQQIGENANFEISGDSIYYPDADRRLHFTINDSTMTVLEENGEYSFKSNIIVISQDSLIMISEGMFDTLVFLRSK